MFRVLTILTTVAALAVTASPASADSKKRLSMPNGRTDVIKAMGNTKWDAPPLIRYEGNPRL